MYNALDIAKWFLVKNNAEIAEHEVDSDNYEVYEGITHLKLQKLLYYAQGISLALYHRPLFKENIEAWMHGPVVREVYSEYNTFGRRSIEIEIDKNTENIITELEENQEINNILNTTYNNFAIYTAWQLREMTHESGSPWDITQKEKGLGSVIDNELIKEYFVKEIVE